jgi:hypothetical protein
MIFDMGLGGFRVLSFWFRVGARGGIHVAADRDVPRSGAAMFGYMRLCADMCGYVRLSRKSFDSLTPVRSALAGLSLRAHSFRRLPGGSSRQITIITKVPEISLWSFVGIKGDHKICNVKFPGNESIGQLKQLFDRIGQL